MDLSNVWPVAAAVVGAGGVGVAVAGVIGCRRMLRSIFEDYASHCQGEARPSIVDRVKLETAAMYMLSGGALGTIGHSGVEKFFTNMPQPDWVMAGISGAFYVVGVGVIARGIVKGVEALSTQSESSAQPNP